MSFRVKAKTRHLAPNARKALNPAGLVNIKTLEEQRMGCSLVVLGREVKG